MSILSGLLGNASKEDVAAVQNEFKHIFADSEKVEAAYKLIRDLIIFTNKRLLLIDIQGLTGKKKEFHSIPYKSITHYSVETAGTFDLDSELKIYLSGYSMPISKQFKKGEIIFEISKTLTDYIVK